MQYGNSILLKKTLISIETPLALRNVIKASMGISKFLKNLPDLIKNEVPLAQIDVSFNWDSSDWKKYSNSWKIFHSS